MDLERSFGTTSQSQQRLQGFPLRLQAQENDGADKLFLHGINKPGVFEKEISSLDEKDGDTVGRLLCWAALTNQHPGISWCVHGAWCMTSDLQVVFTHAGKVIVVLKKSLRSSSESQLL